MHWRTSQSCRNWVFRTITLYNFRWSFSLPHFQLCHRVSHFPWHPQQMHMTYSDWMWVTVTIYLPMYAAERINCRTCPLRISVHFGRHGIDIIDNGDLLCMFPCTHMMLDCWLGGVFCPPSLLPGIESLTDDGRTFLVVVIWFAEQKQQLSGKIATFYYYLWGTQYTCELHFIVSHNVAPHG